MNCEKFIDNFNKSVNLMKYYEIGFKMNTHVPEYSVYLFGKFRSEFKKINIMKKSKLYKLCIQNKIDNQLNKK